MFPRERAVILQREKKNWEKRNETETPSTLISMVKLYHHISTTRCAFLLFMSWLSADNFGLVVRTSRFHFCGMPGVPSSDCLWSLLRNLRKPLPVGAKIPPTERMPQVIQCHVCLQVCPATKPYHHFSFEELGQGWDRVWLDYWLDMVV